MSDPSAPWWCRQAVLVVAAFVVVASLPTAAGAVGAPAAAPASAESPALQAEHSQPCRWSSFRRDAAGTSYVPGVEGPTDLPREWSRTFSGRSVSGVSAADGRLYGAAAEVFALEPATGDTLWTFPNNAADLLPRPVASENRVYLVPDGRLVALDADDGTEAWRVSFSAGAYVPTLDDGVAYLPVNGALRAYDGTDGDRRWRANLSGSVTANAVVAGGAVYVTDDSGRLTAVDAGNGTVLPGRSATVTGSNGTVLAATDRSVLVLNATGVRAVALDDGSVRWENESLDVASTPSLAVDAGNDTAYVAVAGGLVALNTTSGAVRWRQTAVAEPTVFTFSATKDSVVVGAGSSVVALDADDGSVLARANTGDTVQSAHVVGDRVYADFGTTVRAYGGPKTAVVVDSPVVGSSLPGDLDCDGRYEDVNGDGTFNVLDVAEFLDEFESTVVSEHVSAFDFNGDGSINIIDVATLLDMT